MCCGLQCHSCSSQLPPQVHFLISLQPTWLNGWALSVFRKPDKAKLQAHLTPVLATFLHGRLATLPSKTGYLTIDNFTMQTGTQVSVTYRKYRVMNYLALLFKCQHGIWLKINGSTMLWVKICHKGRKAVSSVAIYLYQPSFSQLPTSVETIAKISSKYCKTQPLVIF